MERLTLTVSTVVVVFSFYSFISTVSAGPVHHISSSDHNTKRHRHNVAASVSLNSLNSKLSSSPVFANSQNFTNSPPSGLRRFGYLREKRRTTTTGASSLYSADNIIMGTSKISSGCPSSADRQCLRCNIDGCIKCPTLLIKDTRQCTDICPSGYMEQWSDHPEFMGKICVSNGLSGPLLAAIAGLLAGFLICFSLLLCAVYFVRRKRRRKTIKQKLINENTIDRTDFLQQLNEMRPNAAYFLSMLNDTRRQIRKLYLAGDITSANSYREVVRDLAKILILLNRPIELIASPPPDWGRLYAWSEQTLERYKPEVGQLIDFYQCPNDRQNDESPYKKSLTNAKLLKSNGGQMIPTNHQKHQIFGSLISLHEFDEPRPSDPFGSSFNTLKSNLISDLNTSSIWVEDEFFKLGFRPQDEITTEL